MKPTPEQKAFREYGKALGRLERFREDYKTHPSVRCLDMRHFWREAPVCCSKKEISNQHSKLIQDAWQKRATCRAWVHPMRRRCSNCKHELTQYKFYAACVHEGWPVYWEPRKEGES